MVFNPRDDDNVEYCAGCSYFARCTFPCWPSDKLLYAAPALPPTSIELAARDGKDYLTIPIAEAREYNVDASALFSMYLFGDKLTRDEWWEQYEQIRAERRDAELEPSYHDLPFGAGQEMAGLLFDNDSIPF